MRKITQSLAPNSLLCGDSISMTLHSDQLQKSLSTKDRSLGHSQLFTSYSAAAKQRALRVHSARGRIPDELSSSVINTIIVNSRSPEVTVLPFGTLTCAWLRLQRAASRDGFQTSLAL